MIPLPATTTYQMGPWYRICFSLVLAFCGVLLYYMIRMLIDWDYHLLHWESWVFLLIMIPLLSMVGYFTHYNLEMITGRLKIESDYVEYKSLLRRSRIPFAEIRGYQAVLSAAISEYNGKESIAIVPTHDIDRRTIKISPYIRHHDELLEWLEQNFKRLLGRSYVDR